MPHYRKTFLKQVILRLDYERLPALQNDRETPFTEDMRARYPVVVPNQSTQLALSIGPQGMNVGQQAAGWTRTHTANDGPRTVTLAPDFLALEYGADQYQHFPDFLAQLQFVLESFRRHFGRRPFSRVGLRYVNEITFDEGAALDWDGMIDPDLVTAVKAGLLNGLRMTRSIHQLMAVRDDVSVTLIYGINNPDFPNPVSRRQFLLDLDCYISGVEEGEVERRLIEINAIAERMFEESIEDGLRNTMGIIQ